MESDKGTCKPLSTEPWPRCEGDSIEMLCTRRLPNGRAIVNCDSNRTAMKAALAIHLNKFSGRYIEVYVHTDVDRIFALKGVK